MRERHSHDYNHDHHHHDHRPTLSCLLLLEFIAGTGLVDPADADVTAAVGPVTFATTSPPRLESFSFFLSGLDGTFDSLAASTTIPG